MVQESQSLLHRQELSKSREVSQMWCNSRLAIVESAPGNSQEVLWRVLWESEVFGRVAPEGGLWTVLCSVRCSPGCLVWQPKNMKAPSRAPYRAAHCLQSPHTQAHRLAREPFRTLLWNFPLSISVASGCALEVRGQLSCPREAIKEVQEVKPQDEAYERLNVRDDAS